MSGKKLINKPENVVDEALEGLTMIHPGLRLLEGHRVVLREEVTSTLGTWRPIVFNVLRCMNND